VRGHQSPPRRKGLEPTLRVGLADALRQSEQMLQATAHGRITMQRTVKPTKAAQQRVIDGPRANAAYRQQAGTHLIDRQCPITLAPHLERKPTIGNSLGKRPQGIRLGLRAAGRTQGGDIELQQAFSIGITHQAAGMAATCCLNQLATQCNSRAEADLLADNRPTQGFKWRSGLRNAKARAACDQRPQLGVCGVSTLEILHGLVEAQHLPQQARQRFARAPFINGRIGCGIDGKPPFNVIACKTNFQTGGAAVPDKSFIKPGFVCRLDGALGELLWIATMKRQHIRDPKTGRQR